MVNKKMPKKFNRYFVFIFFLIIHLIVETQKQRQATNHFEGPLSEINARQNGILGGGAFLLFPKYFQT